MLKILGPLALVCSMVLFVPLWPSNVAGLDEIKSPDIVLLDTWNTAGVTEGKRALFEAPFRLEPSG